MNFLFLDFDGVLNSEQYVKNCGRTGLFIADTFEQYDLKVFWKTSDICFKREDAIKQWLEEHGAMHENYVVLDDTFLDSTGFLKGHFVKTSNYRGGLSEENVNEAIHILFQGNMLSSTAEELEKAVKDNCVADKKRKNYTLTINGFFGKGLPLKLTFFKYDGSNYVRDNGFAVKALKKHLGKKYSANISYSIFPAKGFLGEEIVTSYSQGIHINIFLHQLVLLANADLIYRNVQVPMFDCKCVFDYRNADLEDLNYEDLLTMLDEMFRISKQENRLVISNRHGFYPEGPTNYSHRITPVGNESFRISDNRRHRWEGELLECFFMCGGKDIREYQEFVQPYLDRFNGSLENNEVSVIANNEDGMVQPLLDFYNLAMIMSELCRRIDLFQK